MFDRPQLLNFVLRFILLFGLLVVPWPGIKQAGGGLFQAESRLLLRWALPGCRVAVQSFVDPLHPEVDTRITVADPQEMRPDGKMPAKVFNLDSRSLGWMPNAMLLALAIATPWPWSRRWKALLAGGAVVNVFVAVSILVCIGDGILRTQSPDWRGLICLWANQLLVNNLWSSFLFPTLVWFAFLMGAPPDLKAKDSRPESKVRGSGARRIGARARAPH